MPPRNRRSLLLSAVLAAVLAGGLAELFHLRFEAGDVYPPYSSLRADPLGTKAFADGLAGLPGVTVERIHRPPRRLRLVAPTTLFVLGLHAPAREELDARDARALEALAAEGHRLVIAFHGRGDGSCAPDT